MAAKTLMELLVKLGLDSKPLTDGLKKTKEQAKKSSTEIGDILSSIGKTGMKVGGVMTAGITVPIVAMGVASVKAASDLNESLNKTQVVFGQNGKAIEEWSKQSATAFGLSQARALDAAGGFGAMFKAMGIGTQQTYDMSTGLVKLAADMGSLYNVDPTDMLDKLRSGMAGEIEPLRQFGIMITENNVKLQAQKMGLGDAKGALTDAEKAAARYALITQQAAVANGDFANTSGGLANSTRIMTAEFENLKAKIGTDLLPIAIQLMQGLVKVLDIFLNLPKPVQDAGLAIAGLLAILGPVIVALSSVVSAAGTLMSFLGVSGGLSGIVTALTPLLGVLGGALAAISAPVWLLIGAIVLLVATIAIFGKQAWNTVTDLFKIFYMLGEIAGTSIANLINKFRNANWLEIGENIMRGIVQGIENGINWIVDAARDAAQRALDAAKELLGISSPSAVFANVGQNMMLGMAKGIQQFANIPVNMTTNMVGNLVPAMDNVSIATPAGGGSTFVQVMYSPMMSFSDDQEIARRLAPAIEAKVRNMKTQGRI